MRGRTEVYRHIDANIDRHIAQLQRWVRQPSVSAQKRGITEMANMVADDLRALGFREVALVPTSGHPGVFGVHDAGAPRTLVIYMMYDVQPEETGWKVPAFDGALENIEAGRVLMARGATNQKGPERAFSQRARVGPADARQAHGQPDRGGAPITSSLTA